MTLVHHFFLPTTPNRGQNSSRSMLLAIAGVVSPGYREQVNFMHYIACLAQHFSGEAAPGSPQKMRHNKADHDTCRK
jgi:hypothetical protein